LRIPYVGGVIWWWMCDWWYCVRKCISMMILKLLQKIRCAYTFVSLLPLIKMCPRFLSCLFHSTFLLSVIQSWVFLLIWSTCCKVALLLCSSCSALTLPHESKFQPQHGAGGVLMDLIHIRQITLAPKVVIHVSFLLWDSSLLS
jgi:hypothetical protein